MTEIIVYRNPAEAALWSVLTSANAFPIAIGLVVGFLVLVVIDKVCRRFLSWNHPVTNYAPLLAGAVSWVGVGWLLWV